MLDESRDNPPAPPAATATASSIARRFSADYVYRLHFTRNIFDLENPLLGRVLAEDADQTAPPGAAVIVDHGVAEGWPNLLAAAATYLRESDVVRFDPDHTLIIPGGEQAKNDTAVLENVIDLIDRARLCRHSYLLVVGGGAVLDVAGYAAAISHRGIRLIRVPTTTLAQGDAGIGVKNGINYRGKKNFLGTFAVPWAVINDEALPATLPMREWRCGFSEAIKVSLVKDAELFARIEADADRLAQRDDRVASPIIQRCASLHLDHITEGGDPFEALAARPLDFGHWSAHKLEQMTDFDLPHGEAVAIGIAIDTIYSALEGRLQRREADRVLQCLKRLGFTLFHPKLRDTDALFDGLDEFREHLGGRLTIALLDGIGRQVDVHEINRDRMHCAIAELLPHSIASR